MATIYEKAAQVGRSRRVVDHLIALFGKERAENIIDDLTTQHGSRAATDKAIGYKTASGAAPVPRSSVSQKDLRALAAHGITADQVNAAYKVYGDELGAQLVADVVSRDGGRQQRGQKLFKMVMRQVTPQEIDDMAAAVGVSQDFLGVLMRELGADQAVNILLRATGQKAMKRDVFWGGVKS